MEKNIFRSELTWSPSHPKPHSPKVCESVGSEDGGERPCGQLPAVDGSDVLLPKEVREVRRQDREEATIEAESGDSVRPLASLPPSSYSPLLSSLFSLLSSLFSSLLLPRGVFYLTMHTVPP